MSDYFDALMRSSGMAVSRPNPLSTSLEQPPTEAGADRSTVDAEAEGESLVSAPGEPEAPLRTPALAEPAVPQRLVGSVDRHAPLEPAAAPVPARGAAGEAGDSSHELPAPAVESPRPDLAHTLVPAAMRWVAAGTSHDGPAKAAGAVSEATHGVPAQPSSPPVHAPRAAVATKRPHRDVDDARPESANVIATSAVVNLTSDETHAAKSLPLRASPVASPPPPVVPLVRDDLIEVSIGAIHVRVDAPAAQTVARPLPPPAASAPGAATARPVRSALSRRALRRI